jgi:hypothetical protein
MSPAQLGGLDSSIQVMAVKRFQTMFPNLAKACGNDYALANYNSKGWLKLNRTSAPEESDAVVPVTSAFDGLATGPGCVVTGGQTPPVPCNFTAVQYAVHGPGTVSEGGFPGPSLLDASTGVPLATMNLLNARLSDAFVYLPVVPVASMGTCR